MLPPVGGSTNFSTLSEATPDVLDYLLAYDTSGTANAKELIAKLLKCDNRHSLTIANNVSDASHDLDITWGYLLDSTKAWQIKPGSGTIEIDNTFDDGANNKGRQSGAAAIASGQTNHIFVIVNPTTGGQRLFCGTSLTPTLPTGYSYYRRIWSGKLDATPAIRPFIYSDGWTMYKTPVLDENGYAVPSTATNRTATVPTGMKLLLQILVQWGNASADDYGYIRDPDLTDSSPSGVNYRDYQTLISIGANSSQNTCQTKQEWCNSSGQLAYRSINSASNGVYMTTRGYFDPLVS